MLTTHVRFLLVLLLALTGPFLSSWLLSDLILPRLAAGWAGARSPGPGDLAAVGNYVRIRRQVEVLLSLADSDPSAMTEAAALHFSVPSAHRDDPGFLASIKSIEFQDPFYQEYAMGLYRLKRSEWISALRHLNRAWPARNRIPGLIPALGEANHGAGNDLQAEYYFRIARTDNPHNPEAYRKLFDFYLITGKKDKLLKTFVDPSWRRHLGKGRIRRYHVLRDDFRSVLKDRWRDNFRFGQADFLPFALSAFATAIWIWFLKKNASRDTRKPVATILSGMVIGITSVYLADVLYVLWELTASHRNPHHLKNIVLFAFGSAAVSEEISKIVLLIPWLFLFSHRIGAAVLFGAGAGLGFSLLENYHYFQTDPASAPARILSATCLHMAATGIAMEIIRGKIAIKRPVNGIILGLGFAVAFHGLYDLFLMAGDGKWGWAGLILLLAGMGGLASFVSSPVRERPHGLEALALMVIITASIVTTGLWHHHSPALARAFALGDPNMLSGVLAALIALAWTCGSMLKLRAGWPHGSITKGPAPAKSVSPVSESRSSTNHI